MNDNEMISFTPDHGWTAHFSADGESWTVPVIGWALFPGSDLGTVVLEDDRFPSTIAEYLVGREGAKFTRLTREAGA